MIDNTVLVRAVEEASNGNKEALELVIHEVKDLVYNLSLKMLLYPEDAQDATQEILIKLITKLSTFKNESKFSTWIYRITVNTLLTIKQKKSREKTVSFEEYGELIDTGHSNKVSHAKNEGELLLLEEEVKISCTHGLLMCLSAMDRMVYILTEILEFTNKEGAELLDISEISFRKKRSRAKHKIKHFLNNKCGIVNEKNPCRCKKKIDFLIDGHKISPQEFRFAMHTNRSIDLMNQIDDLDRTTALYRKVPIIPFPSELTAKIKALTNVI